MIPAEFELLLNAEPNLRLSTVCVFLEIAYAHPHGITSKELCKRLKLAQPAVSRAVLRLSSTGSPAHSVGAPLGWIQGQRDPHETRRMIYFLTPLGEGLKKDIMIV